MRSLKMKTLPRFFTTSSSVNCVNSQGVSSGGFSNYAPFFLGEGQNSTEKNNYTASRQQSGKNNFGLLFLVKRVNSLVTRKEVTICTSHAFGQVRGVASNTGGAANLRQQPEYNFNKNNSSTITSLDSQATSIINSYFYSINNSAEFSAS